MPSVSSYLWGGLSRLGLATAVVVGAADQASKLWLIFVYGLEEHRAVPLGPLIDLVLVWNTGISSTTVTPSSRRYGIFSTTPANVPRAASDTPELACCVNPRTWSS